MKILRGGRPWEPPKAWLGAWFEVYDGPRYLGMLFTWPEVRAWILGRERRPWIVVGRLANHPPIRYRVEKSEGGRTIRRMNIGFRKGGSR